MKIPKLKANGKISTSAKEDWGIEDKPKKEKQNEKAKNRQAAR